MNKPELKQILKSIGVVVKGNYIKKTDIKKILATPLFDIKTGKEIKPGSRLTKFRIEGIGDENKKFRMPIETFKTFDQLRDEISKGWTKYNNEVIKKKYTWNAIELERHDRMTDGEQIMIFSKYPSDMKVGFHVNLFGYDLVELKLIAKKLLQDDIL